ncbi:MAG: hypothetical protein RLZZ127_322 [Planctomycetota bacterium]|jgi:lysyl-tRNA synthetase class 2
MTDWRPTATLAALRERADRLDALRAFFRERGVLDVDVPVLQPGANLDPGVEPVRVETPEGPRWIPTSPEHPLKRLVAAGYGAVWAYAPCVRAGERGRRHLPEFRMVEWYRPGWDLDRLLTETVEVLALLSGLDGPIERLPWADAYVRFAGRPPAEIGALYPDLPLDAAQDLCWAERIEPHLGRDRWHAITEWPVARAAQARIVTGSAGAPVAARFEIVRAGIELANGYDECPDAGELGRRMAAESAQRPDRPALDDRLLAALAAGFPPCSGVAVGFDRCIRLRLGLDDIAGTVAFAAG